MIYQCLIFKLPAVKIFKKMKIIGFVLIFESRIFNISRRFEVLGGYFDYFRVDAHVCVYTFVVLRYIWDGKELPRLKELVRF